MIETIEMALNCGGVDPLPVFSDPIKILGYNSWTLQLKGDQVTTDPLDPYPIPVPVLPPAINVNIWVQTCISMDDKDPDMWSDCIMLDLSPFTYTVWTTSGLNRTTVTQLELARYVRFKVIRTLDNSNWSRLWIRMYRKTN